MASGLAAGLTFVQPGGAQTMQAQNDEVHGEEKTAGGTGSSGSENRTTLTRASALKAENERLLVRIDVLERENEDLKTELR